MPTPASRYSSKSAEKEPFEEVVPINSDKTCRLQVDDFLPKKLKGMSLGNCDFSSTLPSLSTSHPPMYKGYQHQSHEISESEVTSSILKGHKLMMAILTMRGRNIEIIHKLWQNKDAKAGKTSNSWHKACPILKLNKIGFLAWDWGTVSEQSEIALFRVTLLKN